MYASVGHARSRVSSQVNVTSQRPVSSIKPQKHNMKHKYPLAQTKHQARDCVETLSCVQRREGAWLRAPQPAAPCAWPACDVGAVGILLLEKLWRDHVQ